MGSQPFLYFFSFRNRRRAEPFGKTGRNRVFGHQVVEGAKDIHRPVCFGMLTVKGSINSAVIELRILVLHHLVYRKKTSPIAYFNIVLAKTVRSLQMCRLRMQLLPLGELSRYPRNIFWRYGLIGLESVEAALRNRPCCTILSTLRMIQMFKVYRLGTIDSLGL
jgi:hypothetical protein